ncbi:MAG: putative DNA binding domain-containing protein [Desulfovibrionaceae bacterium]|nr:putative DNA binding domain-containing protein [Desulfovibrionaceae bacterium]
MRITDQELLECALDLESPRIERTISTKKEEKFGEAICAFANDMPGDGKPGYLLIGVANNGSVSGVQVTDDLLLMLTAFRNDGSILPTPSLQVERRRLEGKDIAVVEVIPSMFPPVRYKGTVWIRTGPSRSKATEQDERILTERRIAHATTFDARPCPDATIEDLSIREFTQYREQAVAPEIIDENHRRQEDQLASLRLYNSKNGCPTYAGLLLLSPEPRQWLPGAYMQYLRFSGTRLDEAPVDEKEIGGNLSTMLRVLDEILIVNLRQTPIPVSPLREETMTEYPAVALREYLMNAVMHRNYESTQPIRFYWFADRIEIQNPGGLFAEARTDFPRNNAYRNPVIAEILKNLGYVNRYGYGIARAEKSLRENGNPEPVYYKDTQDVFGVTICRATQNS